MSNKPEIKIKFIGFWDTFKEQNNLFYNILKEYYSVNICDDPDYIFFTPLGSNMEYMRYDCVRIMFTGEFQSADFAVADYAIDFDYIDFLDRHVRYPLCLYNSGGAFVQRKQLSREQAMDVLKQKKYFCNFIFGHGAMTGMREKLLALVSNYKRVECAGTYLNNMPNGEHVIFGVNKDEFVAQCKFTLAIESVNYVGYVGEKITDAFANYSIPIYYGNDRISTEFNPKAFINCHDYTNYEDVVDKMIEIDQNDELFIDMLTQPTFITQDYSTEKYEELKAFLLNIFSQPKEQAFRRMRWYRSATYEASLRMASQMLESHTVQIANAVVQMLKKKR